MQVADLKMQLHAQIDQIVDATFLIELNELLKFQLGNQTEYQLSPEQLHLIEEGRAEYRAGLGISHEQAMEEVDAWLKEA
ncbi:MAG: hypothetical protein RLZZ519_769 [Bacteroidota bacterium]|jgi:hypothetical protein